MVKSLPRIGLRGRLITLLAFAFTISIAVVAWDFAGDRQERIEAATDRLVGHVGLIAARQQAILQRADAVVNGLMLNPALRAAVPTPQCDLELATWLGREPEFLLMALVSPQGKIVCGTTAEARGIDVADRDYFRHALAAPGIVVSGVITERIGGRPGVAFAKAARDESGRVLGLLVLVLDLHWLHREFGTESLPADSRLVVLDAQGTVVVRLPDPEGLVGRIAEEAPILQRVLASGGSGTLAGPGLDGQQRLFAFAKLLETVSGPMYVLHSVPQRDVEAPVQREIRIRLAITLAVFAATLALVAWGANQLVLRPMRALGLASQRLAAGDLRARSGLSDTPGDLGRLARTLDATAAAIEDRERRLERANRALRVLLATNRSLQRANSEHELLEDTCRVIVETGGYRVATVVYADAEAEKGFQRMAWAGVGAEPFRDTPAAEPVDSAQTADFTRAIASGLPQVCRDVSIDRPAAPNCTSATTYDCAANIVLPLKLGTVAFGGLSICSAEPGAFDEEEAALLMELANQLATGIGMLRVRAERDRTAHLSEHHAEILQQSLERSIEAIAATVEARDPYTAGHEQRVGELAAAIARELDLAEGRVHGIRLAATVHDVGKIRVPAEILSKPGRLSDIEFMLIRTHPQAGYDILKDVDFPWPIAQTVLQHHERLDGSGYPLGLKGSEIILEARIIAVADVVEAMSSHRPYRPSVGVEAALAEIGRGRGTLYDATVADACLRLFGEGRFSFSG